jgi:uncharacterized protein YecT (DUF1311 family)
MVAPLLLAAALSATCTASGVDQQEMACLAALLPRLEAELDGLYRLAIRQDERDEADLDRSRNIPSKVELVKAQRAWAAYRDAHCLTVSFTLRGGSGEGIANAECRADLTQARIEQLKALTAPYR